MRRGEQPIPRQRGSGSEAPVRREMRPGSLPECASGRFPQQRQREPGHADARPAVVDLVIITRSASSSTGRWARAASSASQRSASAGAIFLIAATIPTARDRSFERTTVSRVSSSSAASSSRRSRAAPVRQGADQLRRGFERQDGARWRILRTENVHTELAVIPRPHGDRREKTTKGIARPRQDRRSARSEDRHADLSPADPRWPAIRWANRCNVSGRAASGIPGC